MAKQDRSILPSWVTRWRSSSRVQNVGLASGSSAHTGWEALPDHLLFLVANAGLSVADLLSLSQVCKPYSSLARDPAAWQCALKQAHGELVPRDVRELLCQHHRNGLTTLAHISARSVFTFLRCQQPACLCAPASHGTCLSDPTAQYPQILHLNGTTQRTVQAEFPTLPAGRYLVCLRVRSAPGFQRGYIRFRTVFKKDSKKHNSYAQHTSLQHPDSQAQNLGQHQPDDQPQPALDTELQHPNPQLPGADGDDEPHDAAGNGAGQEPGAEADREHNVQRSIKSKRLPFLQRVHSHLLGRYVSSWHMLERATMADRLLPMTPKAVAANLGESAAVEHCSTSQSLNQQQQQQQVAEGEGWGDVFVGHVVLYRQCRPAFTLAFVQVMSTPNQMPDGVFIDCVRLVPVVDLASHHN